jgi:hypothetical protein
MEIDLNDLFDATKASMKGSGWKEEPQRFYLNFLSEIIALKKEVDDKTYKTSKGSEFILNERGKTRYIHGGKMRDRVIRHAYCDTILNPALEKYLIHNNGASRKGKGITFSRKMFERDLHNFYLKYGDNDGYVGFIDLSKFYDNIDHEKVKAEVFKKLQSDDDRWLFAQFLKCFEVDVSYMTDEEYENCTGAKFDSIEYHKKVTDEMKTGEKMMAKSCDIGDQTSQSIGIFFPTVLDNYAKIVKGCKWYGRYMDDIYIICRSKKYLQEVMEGIEKVANKYGLFVNHKKTHVFRLSSSFKYLQIKYSLTETGKVIKRINPKSITRERRKLKAYRRQVDKGIMTYEDVEQAYKSWMGAYYPIMSKVQIFNMKKLFKDLYGKEPKWKSNSKTAHQSKRSRTDLAISQPQSRSSQKTLQR